jgi:hypothetical protein
MQERKISMTQARTFTAQEDYKPYILQVIRDAGGSAHIHYIHKKTRELMCDVLLAGDETPAIKGNGGLKERFGYYVSRALTGLKHDGKVRHGTERGMWELVTRPHA